MTVLRAQRGAWSRTGRATGSFLRLPATLAVPLKQSSAEPLSDMADDEAPQKENVMKEVRPPSCSAAPLLLQALARARP
jgi:hypothetical protein